MCIVSVIVKSRLLLSHHAGITANVHYIRLAAGRRTQAGDATDQSFQVLLIRFHKGVSE